MTTESFREWLLSDDGFADDIADLRRWSAKLSFGSDVFVTLPEEQLYRPDWQKFLLAASILAESGNRSEQETGLMIAQAAMIFGSNDLVRDAGAVVLSQLANSRAIQLAVTRNHIQPGLRSRLGISEHLLSTRRELETAITINHQTTIDGNEFQFEFWTKLQNADWTSATAPTAAGKTFLVLNWLLGEFEKQHFQLGIFLAPTRALVGEIEKQLLELKVGFSIPQLRIASLPIKHLSDLSAPTLLVLTQERLHLFLNACDTPPQIDVTVIDEAQKLNDGSRGVILQDAIERIVRSNSNCNFVYLSPHAANPETLLDDAPIDATTAVVPGSTPTITQNLVLARQKFSVSPLE